jgi:hypothetical protein
LDSSKVGQLLFGATSRRMRQEYPILVEEIPAALWGGKSWAAIKDENHLKRCISYIQRHLPDNTKIYTWDLFQRD